MGLLARLLCILLIAALSGCATLSEQECRSADWYAIGLEDGAQGYTLSRLGEHRKACSEFRIAPRPDDYAAGHTQGLKRFCTYERGLAEGRAGRSYAGACPAHLADAFLDGHRRGKRIHERERRLDEVRGEIRKVEKALKKGIADERERAREVARLSDLHREAARIEQDIADLER